jgi:tetratricopeptide (TPR) repeat protein
MKCCSHLALHFEARWYEAYVGLGIILHLGRQYDFAVVQAHLALDMEPEFFPAHLLLGIAHVQQSRFSEAIADLEKAVSLADLPFTLGYLGYAYGISGKRRHALMVLTELENRTAQAYVSPYAMALVHTGLGQKEQALKSLANVYEDRNEMVGLVKTSPEFDDLRSEEGFSALLR